MSRLGFFLFLLAGICSAYVVDHDQASNNQAHCAECNEIITKLKTIAENPVAEKKLVETLKNICEFPLFIAFKQQCLYAASNIVTVVRELQSLLDDPNDVCETLNFCDANSDAKKFILLATSNVLQSAKDSTSNSGSCQLCKEAADKAKIFFDSLAVKNMIKSIVSEQCNAFPSLIQTESQSCGPAVNDFVDTAVSSIAQLLTDSESICNFFDLCQAKESVHRDRIIDFSRYPHLSNLWTKLTRARSSFGLDLGCIACEVAITDLLKFLSQDKVLDILAKDITDFACKFIPTSRRPSCLDFMGIYAKPLLQLTVTEWTPAEICKAMHLCKGSSEQLEFFSNKTCSACKMFTDILAHELQQPYVQQEVIAVWSEVCAVLYQDPKKTRCQTFAQTYVPYVLTDIFALSLVPRICTALHLC